MQFPFVGASYVARSNVASNEDAINWMTELAGPNAKSPIAMYGTPGIRLWVQLGVAGGIRCCKVISRGLAYVVCGSSVFAVSSNGTISLIGSIEFATTPVSIASNGTVAMLVTGPSGYFINIATGVITEITDPDFLGADVVDFCDGYFVFNRPGTGIFQITRAYSTEIDALDFQTAEGAPDNLRGLIVDHREIWLGGERTIEVYSNTGNADFPFSPIPGAFIEQGLAATFSMAKLDNTIYWLGEDDRGKGVVFSANGYNPLRVSTHAVEYDIAKFSDISDAVAYTYQQEGHSFYVLNFPTGNRTWVYDVSTKLWHKRAWRNPIDGSLNCQRQRFQMQFAGHTIVGDWQYDKLYILDLNEYTDNGDIMPSIRICPCISGPNYQELFFSRLTIDVEQGVGTSDVLKPIGVLEISNDGGKTYPISVEGSIGAIGEYRHRITFTRLGRARNRVYKYTITDPVKRAIVGASSEHAGGRA